MSWNEYDEELHIKNERGIAFEEGVEQRIKLEENSENMEKSREECIKGAIGQAIEECIQEGILSDFLTKNRAEVLEMSWNEYEQGRHIENERAMAFEEGVMQERKRAEEERKATEQEIERLRKELEMLKAQR